jgi:hypothetical protein
MIRYYNDCIDEIVEPLFRRLSNSTFNELLYEINPNEEIIGIFERNNIKIALFIESQFIFDKFMDSVHSNHFDKFEFYSTKKKINIESINENLSNFLKIKPLNLSGCLLTIEQQVILPDHILKIEKEMEEKREIAIALRMEVKQDIGLSPRLSPPVYNPTKIKSRSGSSENISGIKKNVSFKNILTDVFPIQSNDLVDSIIVTASEYIDSNHFPMDNCQ